jgi:hypothetical protein
MGSNLSLFGWNSEDEVDTKADRTRNARRNERAVVSIEAPPTPHTPTTRIEGPLYQKWDPKDSRHHEKVAGVHELLSVQDDSVAVETTTNGTRDRSSSVHNPKHIPFSKSVTSELDGGRKELVVE